MSKFKDMTKEELKQEFIKWFGEEKWEEQEIIDFLEGIVCDVCREYLGISPVPVVFEKIKGNIEQLLISVYSLNRTVLR